jgi:predicted anti-sigma-YlaC factor YlaD
MNERYALQVFFVALGVMILIGAILPSIAPGLVSLLNRTVLTGEDKTTDRH